MAAHSKVGASSAKRWLACPGSVALADSLDGDPDLATEEGDFAADGTFAHRVLELALADRLTVPEALVQALAEEPRKVPDWCEETVQAAFDVLAPIRDRGDAFWTEIRVEYAPQYNGFGTCDFAAVDGDTLVVGDFKSGAGVRVKAERNEQLLCYAVGVWSYINRPSSPLRDAVATEVRKVRLLVIQPRIPGGITSWELTIEELREWGLLVMLEGIKATRQAGAALKTGEHCRFCPALAVCPRWQEIVSALTNHAKRDADVSKLDPKQVRFVLENASLLRAYIKAVEAAALKMALAGRGPDGYKVVPGKTNRQWRGDEAREVLELLYGPDAFEPASLKSPAQIEALPGGKHVVAQHAYQPEGGPTLVPITDQRPAWQPPNFRELFNPNAE